MTMEMMEKLKKYGKHFAHLFNVNCQIFDTEDKRFATDVIGESLYFCPFCNNKECDLKNIYFYGCSEAYRWSGKYIYFCHEGFSFIASSLSNNIGELTAGLVLGPFIMGDLENNSESLQEIGNTNTICNIPTDKVNDMTEIIASITESISGMPHSKLGNISYKQEDVLQALYNQRDVYENSQEMEYPIDLEKQLQICIQNGDKQGINSLLNQFLSKLYLISNYNMEIIKIRVIELITILSRATIDAGANSNEIIWFNTGYIKQLQNCSDVDEISVWLTQVLHKFITYSFDFSSVKHSDTVYKVIDYIRNNYFKKISLDDIASYVNFSKTYLSRIFKDETGQNISMYINKVRIEKAKMLLQDKSINLIDVANLVGFEDQSYFTKVFKSVSGTSPKRYKELRNKI